MPLGKSLGGQRRSEIGVVGLHQIDGEFADAWVVAPVRLTATGLVHQPNPPFSWYRLSSRYVCRSLMPNKETAAVTVRLPGCTSLRTSTRLTSRSLILVHPILRT